MFHIRFVGRRKRKGDNKEGRRDEEKGNMRKDKWMAIEDKKL